MGFPLSEDDDNRHEDEISIGEIAEDIDKEEADPDTFAPRRYVNVEPAEETTAAQATLKELLLGVIFKLS